MRCWTINQVLHRLDRVPNYEVKNGNCKLSGRPDKFCKRKCCCWWLQYIHGKSRDGTSEGLFLPFCCWSFFCSPSNFGSETINHIGGDAKSAFPPRHVDKHTPHAHHVIIYFWSLPSHPINSMSHVLLVYDLENNVSTARVSCAQTRGQEKLDPCNVCATDGWW